MKEEKTMKYVKDFCLLEIKEDQNLTHEMKGANGETVTLILDNEYNRMAEDFIPDDDSYIPHEATILSMPKGLSPKFERNGINLEELKAGDKVLVNHLAVNANNKLTKDKYFLSIGRDLVGAITSNIIAVRNGENIEPVYDWNTFEPVENKHKESTIIIPDHIREEKREDILKVISPSRKSIAEGINPGDKVVVNPDAIYPIEVEGKKIWFVRNENILLRIL